MELTDLEICKRIAEIEGQRFICQFGKEVIVDNGGDGKLYNPLTDDALCFQLMVKYRVSIDADSEIAGILTKVSRSTYEYIPCVDYDETTTINKAICLAIIEVHKND